MSNNTYVISSIAVAPEQKGGNILYHHQWPLHPQTVMRISLAHNLTAIDMSRNIK